ncbi:VOC family protein [Nocardioides sp. WV_118_6]|uniref:VOC family protein n=1 Tax=Nocardioides simplex TaxID=2045 RepID=UPI00214FDC14|nr:VOC family protein [Pimelobacter simplex]UUW91482.1 VOC family protein [Pimelobacter simplex]UUW95310.1 VOC family protein [Pimelobacter simplex]
MNPPPVLTGVRRADHVGLTVPDLDQAHAFLVDVLGATYRYALPRREGSGDWMRTHLGVDATAAIAEIRFFELGGLILEVFAWEAPDQRRTPPRNSDVGGHHLALYVDDLDLAVDQLRAAGIEVMGAPTASTGAHLGQRWVYVRAPWGLQLELVSYPTGRAVDVEPARYRADLDRP